MKYVNYDTDSILPWLKNGQAQRISYYLKGLMVDANISNRPIYVSLPPTCSKIDCFKTESFNEGTPDFIKTQLKGNGNEEYAIGIPMLQGKYGSFYTTGAGVPLKFINILLEAAKESDFDLASVEPDIFAAIRSIWQYDKRFTVLNIGEDVSYFTLYDYSKGVFTFPHRISATELLQNGLESLKEELRVSNMVAQKTFGSESSFDDCPIYVLADCLSKNTQKLTHVIKNDTDIGKRFCTIGETAKKKISFAKKFEIASQDTTHLSFALGLTFKVLLEERRSKLAESANDEFIAGIIPSGEGMPEKEKPNQAWHNVFNSLFRSNNTG